MMVRPSSTRTGTLSVLAAACLTLAACGSAVDPKVYAAANGIDRNAGTAAAAQNSAAPALGGGQPIIGPTGGAASTRVPSGGTANAANPGTGTGPGAVAGNQSQAAGNGQAANQTSGGTESAGSCAGFSNGTGVSSSEITIAQAADISGPVPGLFKTAQDATRAYVAYFNATHPNGICGRHLHLITEDTQTSDGGDQAAAIDACSRAFAMVGSMSAFDGGGAPTAARCGIPDLRAVPVTTARTHSATTYGAYSLVPNLVPSIIPETVKRLYPQAVRAAALVYLDAGAAQTNGESFKVAWSKVGFNFVYDHSLEVTDLSYDAYVNAMYDKHVTYIMYTGAYQNGIRLARSIAVKKAADPTWKPVFQMDSVAYDAGFVGSGGPAIADTLAYTASGLNEAPTPELSLYSQWLSRVSPGSTPTYFGQFAWSAARLFTDEALALGGKLNRQSLLNAVRTVHAWTGHGMHATMDVGGRISPRCTAILQLRNGVWVNVGGGRPYVCGTLINTGVGAG